MSDVWFYIRMGIDHIFDSNGIDHLLFIVSFCLTYTINNWRKVALLVTAFTLGHSITLLLVGLNLVQANIMTLVEFLIPITILFSCTRNYRTLIIQKSNTKLSFSFLLIFIFGLIHGLGFSNFIKHMLFDNDNLIISLLGFNLGIEIAQLIIVIIALSILSLIRFIKKHVLVLILLNTIITLTTISLLLRLDVY